MLPILISRMSCTLLRLCLHHILVAAAGPNDVFLSLEGKCFEKTVNQYVYEVCPFNAAFQKEGSRKTSLGYALARQSFMVWLKVLCRTFSDWAEKYSRMSFTEGERCWNGPKRSVTVNLNVDRGLVNPNNDTFYCLYC